MKKDEAKAIFGSVKKIAAALEYTPQYFYMQPDPLPQREADRIRGAALRLGLLKSDQAA